jgi:hypothetical protein
VVRVPRARLYHGLCRGRTRLRPDGARGHPEGRGDRHRLEAEGLHRGLGQRHAGRRSWVTEGTLDQVAGQRLSDLGAPTEEELFSAYGIDFCPFVRILFSDAGEKRGIGAIQRALEPIAEADLSATNLHAMVYQDAEGAWVVTANGTLPDGRPLPPDAGCCRHADVRRARAADLE